MPEIFCNGFKDMKNIIIISSLFFLAILFSCSSSNTHNNNSEMILDELPEINDLFGPRGVSTFSLLISSAQFSRAYSVNCKNIHYDIAVSVAGQFQKVVFIATDDKAFVTPEELKINDSLANVRSVTDNEILTEPGWAFYIPLDSGWNAAFTEGESMTDNELKSSYIKLLFENC